jgi:hypothetical protein
VTADLHVYGSTSLCTSTFWSWLVYVCMSTLIRLQFCKPTDPNLSNDGRLTSHLTLIFLTTICLVRLSLFSTVLVSCVSLLLWLHTVVSIHFLLWPYLHRLLHRHKTLWESLYFKVFNYFRVIRLLDILPLPFPLSPRPASFRHRWLTAPPATPAVSTLPFLSSIWRKS